jgi:hypothetical protein
MAYVGRMRIWRIATAGLLGCVASGFVAERPRPAAAEAAIVSNLDYPFIYPMSGVYTGNYPSNPHEGYDIFGYGSLQSPSPVFASHSGYVWETDPFGTPCVGSQGSVVRIRHGGLATNANGLRSNYHHLSSVVVPNNSWVAAGQLIGFEGHTGLQGVDCSQGNIHLHVEYRRENGGTPVAFPSFFVSPNTVVAAGSPIGFDGIWGLNGTPDSSVDKTVFFGLPGDIPITGDWDGNGRDGLGVVRFDPSTLTYKWYLSNTNLATLANGSAAAVSVSPIPVYGLDGDMPVAGDWDDDGDDSPGVYRRHSADNFTWYYLTNVLNPSGANVITAWGGPYNQFHNQVGDWNCDGKDTPGAFRITNAQWYLTNTSNHLSTNSTSYTPFAWGLNVDLPMAGDFLANGCDRPIVFQKNPASVGVQPIWYRNGGLPGTTVSFTFGTLNDFPMVLNWDTDNLDEYAILN